MRNCFFEDNDFTTTVRPESFIKKDKNGYFIDIKINKSDVLHFMVLGVIPKYVQDKDIFVLSVAITNSTKIRINGMKANSSMFDEKKSRQIPASLISIRELGLKLYSKNARSKSRQCYATKLIFHVDTTKDRKTDDDAQTN